MPTNEEKRKRLRYLQLKKKQSLAQQGAISPVEEKESTLFGLPEKVEKAIFPTTSEKKGVGGAFLQGLEALGTPVRLAGKLRKDPETGEKFKASDPESAFFRPEIEKLKGGIPGEGFPSKVARGTVEIGGSILSDPTLPLTGLASLAKKGVKKLVELPNKAAGFLAQELSGVSEEALRMAGTKEGSKALIKASGTQRKVGLKLMDAINDFDKFIPENKIIGEALEKMPQIGIKKTVRILEDSIDDLAIGRSKLAQGQIENFITDIKGKFPKKMSAKQFVGLRKRIDKEIGEAFKKQKTNDYISALKDARFQMKEILVRAGNKSGNPEYAQAMQTLAKKMDLEDKLKGFIGKSVDIQNRKVEGFVDNLFGKNSEAKQELVRDLSEMFGQDFLEKSKLAKLAGEIGPGGKPTFLPRQTTGRSLLSVGPQIALGSPSLASKVTLPTLSGLEKGAKGLLKGGAAVSRTLAGKSGLAAGLSGLEGLQLRGR